jgi:hypothetical protein
VADVVGLDAARGELPNLGSQLVTAVRLGVKKEVQSKISTKVSVVLIAVDGRSEVANTFLTKSS